MPISTMTTSERGMYRRAKARQESKRAAKKCPADSGYVLLHWWLPVSTRRKAIR